jgi:L-2-hydroxycarboxylate dehydrogenase (NAD+)
MEGKSFFLPVEVLQNYMREVFIKVGVPAGEAATCAEILITSDLRGIESHGIGRLKMYYDRIKQGLQKPITNFEIVREAPATAVIDGHDGMGQVIGYRSMQMAIEKARLVGMGSVAVRNSSHFGIAGYYPLMAARAGMIGFTVTNARPSISPTFGVRPMLGTNPIAFSAPSDEDFPFIFDAATSIAQRGKLEVLARKEKPTPPGYVIDAQGRPLTDTNAILEGFAKETAALLPLGGQGEDLGGHKGYGLATMVEILSASLQTGSFLWGLSGIDAAGKKQPNKIGHFFMAINVTSFADLDVFKKTTGDIIRDLRSSTREPGKNRIFTAGEKEYENEKRVRANGVEILPNLQKDIQAIQRDLNLPGYSFPF